MSKLKAVTIKELKKIIPENDLKHMQKAGVNKSGFVLDKVKPMNKRDDSLIELEIAFRKCKRVGVFD